jgi:hypothetical protein
MGEECLVASNFENLNKIITTNGKETDGVVEERS